MGSFKKILIFLILNEIYTICIAAPAKKLMRACTWLCRSRIKGRSVESLQAKKIVKGSD